MFSELNKIRKETPGNFYGGIITIVSTIILLYFVLWIAQ